MVRSGSSPGSRSTTLPLWLSPLLVLLLSELVAWLLVPGNAGVALAWSGVVAAAVLAFEVARGQRALSAIQREHAAENADLRHRLASQESATIRLATELLPSAVRRLQQGAPAEDALSGLSADPGLSRELGAAHEAVLRSVIDAVEAQEGLHDSAQRAFVNIARRVQAIVHQQAQDLREMQDRHGENTEFFDDLLHLDHGNALTGRLADSIAVLAGAQPGRQWRQNVPLFNVLRGGMSRIKNYDRVDLHSVAEFAVVGQAVEPLIHALAELLDNATRYSPPHARVHLSATEVQSGVAIEIEDAGVGLTAEARRRAESALAQDSGGLDLDDLGETPRLGLAVVGRLSHANGFMVGLRPSVYGGVRSVLTVPNDLVTVSPVPGGQIARAASLPPPRPTNPGSQPTAPKPAAAPPRTSGEIPQSPAEITRNANGLPQRKRNRGASPTAGAQSTGTVSASGAIQFEHESPRDQGTESATARPGMWLAAFQEGVSPQPSTGDADRPKNDASLGKDE